MENNFGGEGLFPERVNKSLFFDSDIKNSFKNQWGRDREPNFVIFSSLECFNC